MAVKRPKIIQCSFEACRADKKAVNCYAPSYMLHFIRKGSGYFNGIRLQAGNGFLAKYGTIVQYFPDKNDPWEYAWVNFLDPDMVETLESLIRFDGQYTFFYDMSKPYFKLILNAECRRKCADYSYDASFAGTALYYELLSLLAEDSHRKNSSDALLSVRRKHVNEARSLIESNYYRPDFTIETLAESLHLNRAYLRNIFTEFMHCSPKHYLIRTRMSHARTFLEDFEVPVHFVASSVGYEDALQFSKMFKKHFGVSPKTFREKNGFISTDIR